MRKTFPSLAEAKSWRAEAKQAVDLGTLRTPSRKTLAQSAATWLSQAEAGEIRNRSGAAYKPATLGGTGRPSIQRARVVERQVGDLAERVRAELEQDRARDRDLRERAGTGDSQEDLVALYDRAAEYDSIDRAGLRLPAPGLFEIWMRIRVVHREEDGVPIGLVELSVEDLNVRSIGETVLWSPGQPAEEVFAQLARNLQRAGAWQGDKAFDPSAMLGAFANALGRIIDIWSGPGGNPQLRPVAALLNRDWAVTRMGLDSLKTPDVFAEGYELVGDTHHAFMRMEHQVKTFGWDEMEFRMAFAEAERVHQAFTRESPK